MLYSAAGASHAAAFAAEKLERAGYPRLFVLADDLEAWRSAGNEVLGGGTPDGVAERVDGRIELDREHSRLHWVGRNLANLHEGTLGLQSGWVELADGVLRRGELVLDMTRIVCRDLTDPEMNKVLLQHLADHDFFDVERYPEARVTLVEVRHEPAETPGRPDYFGTARLHLRGRDNTLRFELVGGVGPQGGFSLQGPVSFEVNGHFGARHAIHIAAAFL